jgi:hypothetical protein
MTPKKALLQKFYFLTVNNDDTGFVGSAEFPLELAFSIAGRVPSWKVDVIQDGNRFQMSLFSLELAGNWIPLAEKIDNIFWKPESEFNPEVMCATSDLVVEIRQSIDAEDDEEDEYENKVFVYLEELDPSVEWFEIMMHEDEAAIENMQDVYLVLDKANNLAMLKIENHDDLYHIDSNETLKFWTDYYEDDLLYDFDSYKMGQLLAMNAFDDAVVHRLLDEIISKYLELV